MQKFLALILLLIFSANSVYGQKMTDFAHPSIFLKKASERFKKIFHEGQRDLFLTGYAWHNRYTYTPEAIRKNHYNELAYGGGAGRSIYDEDGDWHGLSAVAFLDSHKHVQPTVGYSFLKMLHWQKDYGLGLGYSLLVTQRPDIFHGYPFPGAAPLLSFEYKRAALFASYVPGKKNIGNVLFLFLKISL